MNKQIEQFIKKLAGRKGDEKLAEIVIRISMMFGEGSPMAEYLLYGRPISKEEMESLLYHRKTWGIF